ncbi:MAG: BREX protein BrxB domain-containing protein, partial [Eubacterium sp.]
MSDVLERLDRLKLRIQDEDFLQGKGLSNEVNIHIFCYDPQDEMAVRYFTEQLAGDQELKCRVIEKNLYRIFLQICEENGFLDAISGAEAHMERTAFLEQIAEFADSKTVAEKISEEAHSVGDVIIITGVGEAYPFVRVHAVLDAVQPD